MSTNITITSETILQLKLATKHLNLTFALPLCIIGILGNILNIIVFSTLGNYKHNPASLYTFCKSFYDITALTFGLGLRILSRSFGIDFSIKSQIWCKIRVPIFELGIFNSFTCLCLLSIDAFLTTSLSPSLRQKSNIRNARCILIIFLIFWILHNIPYTIFQDLVTANGVPTCRTTNISYYRYRNYFVINGISSITPITIISFFGIRTYRQLRLPIQSCRSITLSKLAKQMINMTLLHIIVLPLCHIPFAIAQIYSCATEGIMKSPLHQAREELVQMIVITASYGVFAVSSYQTI